MTTVTAAARGRFFRVVPDTLARRRLDWRAMVALSALWFAISYLWNTLGLIVLPVLVNRTVHPTPVNLGLFTMTIDKNTYLAILEGIGTLFAVVWQPAIGALSDHSRFAIGRRRPYIAIGVVGDVVFLSLMTIVTSYWVLLAVYIGLQAFSNTAQGPYQGMLPDQVPDDQRGQASGFYGGLQMAGILIGFFIIGVVLIPNHQLSLAILSIALVIALTGALVVAAVPDVRTTGPPRTGLGRSIALSFVIDVKRYPDFAWLMASRLLFLVALVGIESFVLNFMEDTFRLSEAKASLYTGYLLIAITGLAAVISTTAGHLSERFGRKPFVAAACLIGALGAGLLIFAQSVLSVLIFGAILGVAAGIFLSVDWAFATDLIPKGEAGRYMGVSNIATAGSGIIGRFLMGPIIDYFNHARTSTAGYRVMFGVGLAFFILAFVTLRPVREMKVE